MDFFSSTQAITSNDYFKTSVAGLLLLYANLAAPRLPKYIENLASYMIVKFIIFFAIVYLIKPDVKFALIVALILASVVWLMNYYGSDSEPMRSINQYKKYLYQQEEPSQEEPDVPQLPGWPSQEEPDVPQLPGWPSEEEPEVPQLPGWPSQEEPIKPFPSEPSDIPDGISANSGARAHSYPGARAHSYPGARAHSYPGMIEYAPAEGDEHNFTYYLSPSALKSLNETYTGPSSDVSDVPSDVPAGVPTSMNPMEYYETY